MLTTDLPTGRKAIGIITGSGPEAGLDLWHKVLQANKKLLGEGYQGDLDAPEVNVISVPELGLSMELERNDDQVWQVLSNTAERLAQSADYYAIACNTLNYYQPQLEAMALSAQLVSFSDVVVELIQQQGLQRVALLGAKPVTDLGDWSPYQKLTSVAEVEVPGDGQALHQLIYAVKAHGGAHPQVMQRFAELLDSLESEVVLLACTELPLIPITSDKQLIDVTELVAQQLARRALNRED